MSYYDVAEFSDEQRSLTETLSHDATEAWRLRHIQLWEVKLVKRIAVRAVGFVRKTLSPKDPAVRTASNPLSSKPGLRPQEHHEADTSQALA